VTGQEVVGTNWNRRNFF